MCTSTCWHRRVTNVHDLVIVVDGCNRIATGMSLEGQLLVVANNIRLKSWIATARASPKRVFDWYIATWFFTSLRCDYWRKKNEENAREEGWGFLEIHVWLWKCRKTREEEVKCGRVVPYKLVRGLKDCLLFFSFGSVKCSYFMGMFPFSCNFSWTW